MMRGSSIGRECEGEGVRFNAQLLDDQFGTRVDDLLGPAVSITLYSDEEMG